MTPEKLIEQLQQQGVRLWSEGSRLRYSGPKGAISEHQRAELKLNKRDILQILENEPRADAPHWQRLTRMPRDQRIPLSFAQQSLWFLDTLYPGHTGANEQFAIRLRGTLAVDHLEHAWNALLERHEILRTRISVVDGEPAQLIDPHRAMRIGLTDLTGSTEFQANTILLKAAGDEVRTPFSLELGPLVRVRLFKLSVAEHVLLITVHHIAADGLSVAIIRDELVRLYRDALAGSVRGPEELQIQYADFAIWQRQQLDGESLNADIEFWKRNLRNTLHHVDLPERSGWLSEAYAQENRFEFRISAAVADRLRALARSEGATLFMVLLAAFRTLLYRYSGQQDILIGSPVTLRDSTETRDMIGCMVNNVVFRNPVNGNPVFRQLLERERDAALASYQHRETPFEKVVEAVAPERRYGHHPLFQVMFLFEDRSQQGAETSDLSFDVDVLHGERASYWDLEFSCTDRGPGRSLHGFVGYRADRFDNWFVEMMPAHFETLLGAVTEHPDLPISRLPIMDPAQRAQVLFEWNRTDSVYPEMTLHGLVESQVKRTPDAVALVEGETEVDYRDLNGRANRFARMLVTYGVRPGDRVGVFLDRSIDMIVGVIAILKAGAIYVSLDPSYPQARLAYMLDDAGLGLIVSSERLKVRLENDHRKILSIDDSATSFDSIDDRDLGTEIAPGEPAYVLYTSGSSGTPKGVVCRHDAAVNRCHWMWREYGFGPEDRFAQRTSLNFVDSLWEIFGALGHGISLVIVPAGVDKNPRQLVPFLAQQSITHLVAVPSLLTAVADTWSDRDLDLPELRLLITSGEPLSGNLLERIRRLLPATRVLNTYGTTEIWDATCFEAVDTSPVNGIVPIGHAVPNVRCYVLDPDGEPVPPGVWGELHVGGIGLADAYLNQPALSAEKFIAEPFVDDINARMYRTGDTVRYRPDGSIEYRGRLDRQFKIRGYRAEPGEIEALLDRHPAVDRSRVVIREERPGDLRIVAYVVPVNDAGVQAADLRAHLNELLPEQLVPAAFVTLAEFPLTPSGKVDVSALPGPERTDMTEQECVGPRTDTEKQLTEIWSAVLGCRDLSVHDDFFRLGGHSLLAARLMSRICESMQLDLPLQCLFEASTVAEMATSIDAILWALDRAEPAGDGEREVIRL